MKGYLLISNGVIRRKPYKHSLIRTLYVYKSYMGITPLNNLEE